MNIGFDLDKVFIEYPFFIPDFIIDNTYKKKVYGKLIYRIPSKPEIILRSLLHFQIFRQPIKENIAFAQRLTKKNGDKHYLISGRFGFLRKKTDAIIKKYGIDKIFDKLYFNFDNNQPHIFKNEIIRRLQINRYIDDDLGMLEFLADNNPNVKFFWLNKKINKKLSKNLFAINKIQQILK